MKKQLLSIAVTAGLLLTTYNANASAHESTYKVQAGDTIWKIANANGVTIAELRDWNHLSSDYIYVNQTLNLVAPQTKTHITGNTYTVKAGDTTSEIAKLTGVSVYHLSKQNKLRSNIIYVGQVLKIASNPAVTASLPVSNVVTTKSISTTVQTSNAIKVDELIREAKKHIGTPYVWGGITPAGFDCSGYLNYVFAKVNVTLPRTVASIWHETTKVASPKEGDIVFFETYTSGPSHAGIYLGNNKFIHASSSSGIMISDLTSTYWKSRYLGSKTAF